VPHLELLMSLLAGFAGGLIGTLWGSTVSPGLLARGGTTGSRALRLDTARRLLAGGLLYGASGAALGFLFWLSWALVALVGAPWPAVGVLFGLLCWTGGALPVLGLMRLRLQESWRVVVVLGVEWLVGCLAVGTLCALTWHRIV